MGRPLGSRNKGSAPAAPTPVAQVASEAPTMTASSNEIKRTYREGAATIEIPKSNSSAFLFPNEQPYEPEQVQEQPVPAPVEENVPRETITEQPQPQPVEEQISQPSSDEVVYLEDLLKKMNIDPTKVKTKTKVNGIENDVSILDVKKSYQLEQHLTKRGQQIGEERRQLEALRNELARQPQVPQESSTGDPQYDALKKELDSIKGILPSLQPVIYQNARQSLANELKDQGFPDFMDYIDKIDARVGAEPDENKWRYYNTPEGAKQLYFQMKLEDQMKGVPAKQPEQPKSQARPPIVKIDGGNQPTRPAVDDWATKYNELVAKWKENPNKNKHLLQDILRMKDALYLK